MRQFIEMFKTQLRMTFREKQAWFWGIFFPVILMVVFMVIFSGESDEEFEAKVVFVQEGANSDLEMIFNQLKEIPVFHIESEDVTKEEAEELLKEKEIDAAIVLPGSENETSFLLMVNKEDEQSVTTQAVRGILDEYIQSTNLAVAQAKPTYSLDFEAISSGKEDIEYQDFILTGMIALSIAQGGMFGMVDLVEMRRKGLIKRLRMTPANMGLFGFSDMIMRVIYAIIQLILLTLIGVIFFGANLHINFMSLMIVFLLGALSFNAIGYFISSYSKTTEAYMGVANIASFLMMFLSGVFFPIETMPGWLQPISYILPLTYFVEGIRDTMVYGEGIFTGSYWLGIGVLVVWGIITYILGALLYRRKSIVSTR